MIGSKDDLMRHRLERAFETLQDSKILMNENRWNSAINRLYYAAFYAVSALLLKHNLSPATHNGAKSLFSLNFINNKKMPLEYGKMYSQLFTLRQKGDYDDLFEFTREIVLPYLQQVEEFIQYIQKNINNT